MPLISLYKKFLPRTVANDRGKPSAPERPATKRTDTGQAVFGNAIGGRQTPSLHSGEGGGTDKLRCVEH